MRPTFLWPAVVLLAGLPASHACAQIVWCAPALCRPLGIAPDACGPGFYWANAQGMFYGPSYCLRPPFCPESGVRPGQVIRGPNGESYTLGAPVHPNAPGGPGSHGGGYGFGGHGGYGFNGHGPGGGYAGAPGFAGGGYPGTPGFGPPGYGVGGYPGAGFQGGYAGSPNPLGYPGAPQGYPGMLPYQGYAGLQGLPGYHGYQGMPGTAGPLPVLPLPPDVPPLIPGTALLARHFQTPYAGGQAGNMVFPSQPFVRSPRDFFMWSEGQEDELSRIRLPALVR